MGWFVNIFLDRRSHLGFLGHLVRTECKRNSNSIWVHLCVPRGSREHSLQRNIYVSSRFGPSQTTSQWTLLPVWRDLFKQNQQSLCQYLNVLNVMMTWVTWNSASRLSVMVTPVLPLGPCHQVRCCWLRGFSGGSYLWTILATGWALVSSLASQMSHFVFFLLLLPSRDEITQ